jgi:hypothetical protein
LIKNTILFSFLLLIFYIGFVGFFWRFGPITQHQWQGNLIKAEEYIYVKGDSCKKVIIGTSQSNRLIMDSLPGFVSLSFPGESIFDGLNIVSRQGHSPKEVFIEMNQLMRGEDKGFLGSLFSPYLYWKRKWVPALRDGKQPFALAGKSIAFIFKGSAKIKNLHITDDRSENLDQSKQAGLFQMMLGIQEANYSKPPDPKILNQNLNLLGDYVDVLQKKGSQVIFFEMPVNQRLCNLALAKETREGFYKRFPKVQYLYIPQPECSEYKTTDGVHVSQEDAAKYSSYFRKMSVKGLAENRP